LITHIRTVCCTAVKPANILVSRERADFEQRILLTDFGIARDLEDISGLTVTNTTVGTVAYTAPEQLTGALSTGDQTNFGSDR
jgi:serine/threonine-protein kinase